MADDAVCSIHTPIERPVSLYRMKQRFKSNKFDTTSAFDNYECRDSIYNGPVELLLTYIRHSVGIIISINPFTPSKAYVVGRNRTVKPLI